MPSEGTNVAANRLEFRTTLWPIVLAAGDSASPDKTSALEQLCQSYWYPLYGWVKRYGYNEHDAEDLTQGFFTHLLHGDGLRNVGPRKTKFRTFLLTSLKNFLSDEHARQQAQKRGGGRIVISFDAHEGDARYQLEPVESVTPERLFDRMWATALLDRTLERLEKEFVAAGIGPLLEQLREFVIEGVAGRTYAEVGASLGMTEEAVKKAAQRMRARYQGILREQIAHTVTTTSEIEEELRHLWSALER